MGEQEVLVERFEASRGHLRAVAYRMLGSRSEADDAVQEAWVRLAGADASAVENLRGWLTTVVARICLDMLRARKTRREEPIGVDVEAIASSEDAEREALIADSIAVAMLVVLETLGPAERVGFESVELINDISALWRVGSLYQRCYVCRPTWARGTNVTFCTAPSGPRSH